MIRYDSVFTESESESESWFQNKSNPNPNPNHDFKINRIRIESESWFHEKPNPNPNPNLKSETAESESRIRIWKMVKNRIYDSVPE